jgi:hypothetical protein
MRRMLVAAVLAVAMLAMLVPPALAQTPKVTITGLFDQVMSLGKNYSESNFSRDSDQEWYARTRFRPDFTFEVGRVKAVMGLEFDLTYGQVGSCGGGPSKNQNVTTIGCSRAHPGTTSDAGINTDTTGIIEVKWLYTEFPLTGKDSVMPFIPVETMARAGLQPFASIATYKNTYASGDFAGISTKTTFAPNLLMNFAYVMVEDENGGDNRGTKGAASVPVGGAGITGKNTRGNDFAIITSPEFTPFKGLDIKPLYSLFYAEGTTTTSARRAAIDRHFTAATVAAAQNTTNSASSFGNADNVTNGSTAMHETRHTIGLDARWRFGAFGLDPTFYFQFGDRDYLAWTGTSGGSRKHVDGKMSSFLADIIGSWSAGPLLLEARGVYSPGNKARDSLAQGIHYFEPLDTDTGYYSTWGAILALSDADFGTGLNNGGMTTNVGYDRYGRASIALRATYSLTPALAFFGTVSPTWTAEKVDTDTGVAGTTRTIISQNSFAKGDSNYIGTEFNIGMGWKFAPNASLDMIGAWLNAGHALDTAENLNGSIDHRDARDAYAFTTRVRLSF